MAEFLFVISEAHRRPGRALGEPTSIEEDGHAWGAGERDANVFRIVRVPGLDVEKARAVFLRETVPAGVASDVAAAINALIDATPKGAPKDPAADATRAALAEDVRAKRAVALRYPQRACHVDLDAIGKDEVVSESIFAAATVQRDVESFASARETGADEDGALAASVARGTVGVSFDG